MKFLKRLLVDLWGQRDDDFNWRRHTVPLDPETIGPTLILHLNGKLGDAVIDSLLVDALARHRPEIPVSIGTTKGFEAFWRAHPHVRDVLVFPASKGRSALARVPAARRAGGVLRGRYDVVVSFESFAQPDHFALLRGLAPRILVGFHKNRFRLFDYSLDEGRHGVEARPVVGKVVSVMRVFGEEIEPTDLRPHAPFGPEDEEAIRPFLDRLPGDPRLLMHAYGSGPQKLLSPRGGRAPRRHPPRRGTRGSDLGWGAGRPPSRVRGGGTRGAGDRDRPGGGDLRIDRPRGGDGPGRRARHLGRTSRRRARQAADRALPGRGEHPEGLASLERPLRRPRRAAGAPG